MTDEKQTHILPANPLAGDNRKRMARLKDLWFEHRQGEPNAALLRSVERVGVLQPVIVFTAKEEDGKFWVQDGVRRCKAAKAAKRKEVPIRVIDRSGVVNDDGQELNAETLADLIILVSNNHRSTNAVEELFAIERLLEIVGSLETVARQLSIPLGTLRRRTRLMWLIAPLRKAFNQSRIAVGVAEKVAALPQTKQQQLYDLCLDRALGDFGNLKVTADDVREARQTQVKEIAAALPDEMFEGPTAEDVQQADPTIRVRVKALEDIVDSIVRGRTETAIHAIREILKEHPALSFSPVKKQKP